MNIKKLLVTIFTISIIGTNIFAQNLKPYILAATSDASLAEIADLVKINLTDAGLDVIGDYSPANDENRKVFVITSNKLKETVKLTGGLTGFAATLRVAVTDENGIINISYINPIYWGNAYHRDNYDNVAENYLIITEKISQALANIGEQKNLPFGSEKGLSEKSLRKYRYMIGMQRFNNVANLNEFENYEIAINTIDENLAESNNLIYSIEFPEQNLKLYGVAVGGERGEERFLPIIDLTTPKHTAFLPYELLVVDKKAVMLHGRYRIALAFPDLTMGTFSKIMSTPGDIKKAMKGYTK